MSVQDIISYNEDLHLCDAHLWKILCMLWKDT